MPCWSDEVPVAEQALRRDGKKIATESYRSRMDDRSAKLSPELQEGGETGPSSTGVRLVRRAVERGSSAFDQLDQEPGGSAPDTVHKEGTQQDARIPTGKHGPAL